MTKRNTRIPPLPLEKWGKEEKDAIAAFTKAIASGGLQKNVDKKDQDLSALALFLNYPSLAAAFLPYNAFILNGGELSTRDRELLILRVGWLRKQEYEWAQHVLVCQAAGVSDEDIRRTGEGADAKGWVSKEKWMIRAVDELIEDGFIATKTWNALKRHFDTHQLIELIFVVGTYDMVGMAFNSLGVPLNDNLKGILKQFPIK